MAARGHMNGRGPQDGCRSGRDGATGGCGGFSVPILPAADAINGIPCFGLWPSAINERTPVVIDDRGSQSTAATYSPNWWVSTIGDGELNFSVRNGKRWFLTAIATAVYDLRERSQGACTRAHAHYSAEIAFFAYLLATSMFISGLSFLTKGKSFGLLVQVG